MRQLFILIVLAAVGYLGYNYYQENYGSGEPLRLPWNKVDDTTAPADDVAGAQREDAPPGAPPAPVFKSRVPVAENVPPGEKQVAPPGTFYMIERVSVETPTGIIAMVPGDQVKLLQRKGGTLKLTNGSVDFEVKESQVTSDLEVAREAEKRDFLKRGGRL